jgi:hypothetical protein
MQGRAVFDLDVDRVAVPAGTFVFGTPGVTRTASAEVCSTTSPIARASSVGRMTQSTTSGAIDRSEPFRSYAKEDADFDPIRDAARVQSS